MEPIILASGSPRRQEIFRLLGLPFSIMPPEVDESCDTQTEPQAVAMELARRKVNYIADVLSGRVPPWVAGADTLLSVDGTIYGKPQNRDDARRMLETLGGRSHEVITATALFSGRTGDIDCRPVTSVVTFAPLTGREIEWYLNTGEWQGAAGAYKIQGLAACFVARIEGSYSSIVGLPIREFYVMLRENGYFLQDGAANGSGQG